MDIQKRLQYCSDKLQPQFRYRWMATFVLVCFYALRVYLYGYCILTFFLGMSISTLVMFLLSSRIDPDLVVSSDAPSILPTKASDELRPFVPCLPEFEFWCIVNKILCVALCLTFIPILNLPGIWYVHKGT
ncbi:hypothetical protein CASFOL_020994 [Castilleja foliolosa]|uniref:Protein RER1 n=1 Tax=Castilleja foliolosa TaxID=1961234 RepID=A0ABD3D388_9LAMI